MSSASFLVLVFVLIVTCSVAELATEFVEASEGSTATLPCSVATSKFSDKISNILWYREDEESPFFKFEKQNTSMQSWARPSLQNRYFLRLDEKQAVLEISPVKNSDVGVFHCRVDFQLSPTKITHVNLTVIVPPTLIQVYDNMGPIKRDMTNAYAEGSSLTLTCVATGGKPLPRVTWWRNQSLIADNTQYFPERGKSQCVFKLDKLTRLHLLAVYSCEASNSKRQPPLIVRIAIDMYLRPLEVVLMGNTSQFSAGKKYNITCESRGSRPPAIISWWKDGLVLDGGSVSVSADGNITRSVLQFIPKASDHGLTLTCKASNQQIPFSEMQRTWMLKVHYPPKVNLTLGYGLEADNINEGADVYFECHLTANPWVFRVWWLRDGNRLLNNATAGIIVSNQTLVLQGITKSTAGRYACEAANQEGISRSPPFHLRVRYEPICKEVAYKKIVGAAKDEPVEVECKVEAEPAPTEFRWSFNSTPGIARDLTKNSKGGEGTSILTYTPHDVADYGTLQCWGKNSIGWQGISCMYHVVPAGKPDSPQDCGLKNVTHFSVDILCQRGFDGGLKQKFVLVLYSRDVVVANISAFSSPEFHITDLEPAQEYDALIYSYNSKGVAKYSKPISIRTLPSPGIKELRRSSEPIQKPSEGLTGPWLYILLAAGSTLVVSAVVVMIVFAIRQFKVDTPQRRITTERVKPEGSISHSMDQPMVIDNFTEDDNNPDLIPLTYGLTSSSVLPPYTISVRQQCKRNCATQMPVKPYHVTWAPILQSRNCSTQTPASHKESSV